MQCRVLSFGSQPALSSSIREWQELHSLKFGRKPRRCASFVKVISGVSGWGFGEFEELRVFWSSS